MLASLPIMTCALCAVASTIGAAFVFPGVGDIDGGTSLSAPPFLSGLGPVFLIWLVAPTLTLTLVILLFLMMRTYVMRGEDPFHKVLWVRLPMLPTACHGPHMPCRHAHQQAIAAHCACHLANPTGLLHDERCSVADPSHRSQYACYCLLFKAAIAGDCKSQMSGTVIYRSSQHHRALQPL